MSNIWIIPIEPLDNRYTKHWYDHIPSQLSQATGMKVTTVDGKELTQSTTEGSFLNFSGTSYYKSSQIMQFAELVNTKQVKSGDIVLVTDAWNPTSHMIRYMCELEYIDIKMVGIWHAGQYDPTDILGFTIKSTEWAKKTEESMFELYDINVYATEYHRTMFVEAREVDASKSVVCGFPMEYYTQTLGLERAPLCEKEDIIVFPHRISPEKRLDLFKAIERVSIPYGYNCIVTQEQNFSKEEYYQLLRKAKFVFSANEHENLGIGMFEGLLLGCIPILPNKLSYREMYSDKFKYDADLIPKRGGDADAFAEFVVGMINSLNQNATQEDIDLEGERIFKQFFSGDTLYQLISQM